MFSWNLIGHEAITTHLEAAIKNHKLAHAYLFCGAKQLGKKTLVKKFIQTILCYEQNYGAEQIPCGVCEHCLETAKNTHTDIFWLKKETDKKDITVEQIRELQNNLSLHSFFKSYKIGVIEEAENLNLASANALLKTLEEPSAKVILILITNKANQLPATIISRVQKIKLLPIAHKKIYDYLMATGKTREEAKILAHLSTGRPGRALSFLKIPEFWNSYQSQTKLFFSLLNNSKTNKIKFAANVLANKDITDKSKVILPLLNIWQILSRDLLLSKMNQNDKIINIAEQEKISLISQRYPLSKILAQQKQIEQTKIMLAMNVNPRLALENLLFKF
ncbi:hypothetical protein COX27_01465 [Candidatus Kuenenbacteria bacterium CG23_combo_of_CG06-09_8_20_14_all_36_9]|nr:MAG: hypothetical protein COX27_01465 [Candidatus Kuenenbacteria bacterium CG23_combo_of_CG06-09_8_20_14_all_36_9]